VHHDEENRKADEPEPQNDAGAEQPGDASATGGQGSPEPAEAGDAPVAFWHDEDPNAVPEIVHEQSAGERILEKNTGASEAVSESDDRPPAGNATPDGQPTAAAAPAPAGPATPCDAGQPSPADAGAPAASPAESVDAAAALPDQAQGAAAESTTSASEATASTDAPSFEIPVQVPLPRYEETQEYVGTGGRRKKRSLVGRFVNFLSWLIIVGFFAAIAVGVLYYRYAADRLYNIQFDSNRTVVVTVAPGDRLSQIIEKLRAQGLLGSYLGIDDAYLLKYLAWANENSNRIKSGVYRLNSSMSLSEIYDKLISGSQDFKVTIPEGKTAKETAAIIKRRLDAFDDQRFLALVSDQNFIRKLGLSIPSLEGYLYPDTYFFAPGMKEEDIIRTMVQNFISRAEENLRGLEKTETSDTLSFHEHVIMASLIEREARLDAERPLIASVIFNRLKKGMRLEIDATVNYALGEWGRRLTYDDLKTSSPYNTYLHSGLPPGPICNPRIESLVATFRPARTDYLYYVYKGDGSHAFATTYEEHLANIRLYRRGTGTPVKQSADTGTAVAEKVVATAADDAPETASGQALSQARQDEPELDATDRDAPSGGKSGEKGAAGQRSSRRRSGRR